MKTERRKHKRFPTAKGLLEPITIEFERSDEKTVQAPAILTNISAGGMQLVMFIEPPHTKEIQLAFGLPGLDHFKVTAKILRVQSKGEVYTLGLTFAKITKKDQARITHLADDFNDCETRVSLGIPEVCVPTCNYHKMCSKAQKAPHWPPKV